MHLALVTNFVPDRRPLSEYGHYLLHGLRQARPQNRITVIAGRTRSLESDTDVWRSWDYGRLLIPLQICRTLAKCRVDAVLFNAHFTSWGSSISNFLGLLTPFITHKLGYPTIVILHHLPQTIEADKAGYKLSAVHKIAIHLACVTLARSRGVCFTLKTDANFFRQAFGGRVFQVPHGMIGPEAPWEPTPRQQPFQALTLGNWGRSKSPQAVINLFADTPALASCRLVVAGPSSHTQPGFIEALASQNRASNIEFVGYVPEEQMPTLFQMSNLVILHYSANTGWSGVVQLACQYGRVVVVNRTPLFEELSREMGIRLYMYETQEELQELVPDLLQHPGLLDEVGYANYRAVREAFDMTRIAERIWRLFDGDCSE